MKLEKARPFMAIVFIQFLYALMSIVAKLALNQGMSPHVLVAYRMAVAAALITPFALVLERYFCLLLLLLLLFQSGQLIILPSQDAKVTASFP